MARLPRGRANISRLDSHGHLADGIRVRGSPFWDFRGYARHAATAPCRSAARALSLVWSRAYCDRRNREPVFRTTLYATRWRIEPRSVRGPLSLQAGRDRGLFPGAARHRHDDLPDLVPDATAARVARHVRRRRDRQVGEDDGRFENQLRRQHKSALFGGSHHPAERAEESRSSLRPDRLLSYSDGTVLHPQSFSDTDPRPRFL